LLLGKNTKYVIANNSQIVFLGCP